MFEARTHSRRSVRRRISAAAPALISVALLPVNVSGQQTPRAVSIDRVEGTEPTQNISYALLSLEGTRRGLPAFGHAPRLTAQCTRTPDGRPRFELLTDAGDAEPLVYVPPWKYSQESLYPPSYPQQVVVMDFVGYVKVKPAKRAWEMLEHPAGEMRYATPGVQSKNMEQVAYYLLYLRALPTLRLTVPNKGTLEFLTTPWLEAIRKEPLCKASGL